MASFRHATKTLLLGICVGFIVVYVVLTSFCRLSSSPAYSPATVTPAGYDSADTRRTTPTLADVDTRQLKLVARGEQLTGIINNNTARDDADRIYAEVNYDFSFDDVVSIKFGCTVRAFDPSMRDAKDHQRSPNIWFYKTGLGGDNVNSSSTQGWRMRTLQTLVDELGDTGKIIDYLKIDIEDSEWVSLEAMFQTDILQSHVKQLGIEIHLMSNSPSTAQFYKRWVIMKRLEALGFKRWFWDFNHYGAYVFNGRIRTCCYELVYINTRFMTTSTTTARSVYSSRLRK